MDVQPQLLRRVPLFSELAEDELAAIAALLTEEHHAAGATVLREGEPGGRLHILREGELDVSLTDADGRRVALETIHAGSFVGELSLIDGGAISATVRATQPSITLVLNRDQFLPLLRRRPDLALDFLAAMVQRTRHADGLVRRRVARDPNEVIEEKETLGARVADRVARFGGSWTFISIFLSALFSWIILNAAILRDEAFDPYPFILLNLFLSMLAAFQAPVIMMSQNRQDARDRIRADLDYQVNLKAEYGVSRLLHKVDELHRAVDSLRAEGTARRDPGA